MGPFLAQRGKESAAGAPKSCPVHVPWHAGHWHGPQRWSPFEVNASNGTKVGSGEGTPLLGMGQPHRTTCLAPQGSKRSGTPHLPAPTVPPRGSGPQGLTPPSHLRAASPGERLPRSRQMGRGRGAAFSCFFVLPLRIPRGELSPSPSLSPSGPLRGCCPAPGLSFTTCWGIKGACWRRRATGARGQLLPSVCWGGGGAAAGAGFCFSFHAPLNFAPFVSQRRV